MPKARPTKARTAKAKTKQFPLEHKEKEWTSNRTYKNWVGKLKRAKTIRRSAKKDLCAGKKGICKNDLGISRKHMPQFTARRPINQFRRHIKTEYGINSRASKRTADELKPSQGEINREKVDELIDDDLINNMRVPLVISKDNYIADGHHRWAAFRMAAPRKPMKVVIIDAPIKDVLGMAVDWGAETQQF